MCLITTRPNLLPRVATDDIICYKYFIKKENKRNLFQKLFNIGSKFHYYSPCMGTDFTESILKSRVISAEGDRSAVVIHSFEFIQHFTRVKFDDLEEFIQNRNVTQIQFSSGMIHAYQSSGQIEWRFVSPGEEWIELKCVIPKGTLYAVERDGEICAEKMKVFLK